MMPTEVKQLDGAGNPPLQSRLIKEAGSGVEAVSIEGFAQCTVLRINLLQAAVVPEFSPGGYLHGVRDPSVRRTGAAFEAQCARNPHAILRDTDPRDRSAHCHQLTRPHHNLGIVQGVCSRSRTR
jgi:hypothetical protein